MRVSLIAIADRQVSSPPGSLAEVGPTEIRLPRGETLTVELSVLTPDGGPQNLTGWATVLQVKRLAVDDPADISVAGTVPSLGQVRFAITPANTRRLEPGRFVYDVWTTDPAGNRYQLVPVGVLLLLSTVTTPP